MPKRAVPKHELRAAHPGYSSQEIPAVGPSVGFSAGYAAVAPESNSLGMGDIRAIPQNTHQGVEMTGLSTGGLLRERGFRYRSRHDGV